VGKVRDIHNPEDHGHPNGDEGIGAAQDQAVHQLLKKHVSSLGDQSVKSGIETGQKKGFEKNLGIQFRINMNKQPLKATQY
jgi:hypothetical protein